MGKRKQATDEKSSKNITPDADTTSTATRSSAKRTTARKKSKTKSGRAEEAEGAVAPPEIPMEEENAEEPPGNDSRFTTDKLPLMAHRLGIDEATEDDDEEDVEQMGRRVNSVQSSRIRRPLSPYQLPNVYDETESDDIISPLKTKAKKRALTNLKPGIIYLSTIPPGFNVSRTTSFFAQFGQVGRVFLQPDEKEKEKSKDGLARNFKEGWVEFLSKKVAKEVAGKLNNTHVGGKRRSKAHDCLWNIKYLSKFKWTHLTERLAYEKAVHLQKMRTEVSQAKREAEFFRNNVEKSKRLKRKSKPDHQQNYEFHQREPDDVMRSKKNKHPPKSSGHSVESGENQPGPAKRSKISPATKGNSKTKKRAGRG